MDIKAKRERKAELVQENQALAADVQKQARNMTDDEILRSETNLQEIETLEKDIKTAETIERMASFSQPSKPRIVNAQAKANITRSDCENVYKAWCKAGMQGNERLLTDEEKQAVDKTETNIHRNEIEFKQPEGYKGISRADDLLSTDGTNGGYTVGGYPVVSLLEAEKQITTMRTVSEIITTERGGSYVIATVDDTARSGTAHTEGAADFVQQGFDVGQVSLGADFYSSDIVRITWEMLQDNSVGLFDRIGPMLVKRLARKEQAAFTTGSTGFLTMATSSAITTGSATVPDWQEVVDLIGTLEPANLDEGIVLMMNHATLFKLARLEDDVHRPLFTNNLGTGAYKTFFDIPIVINQSMPNFASTNKAIAVLTRNAYKIRDVGGIVAKRFDELYAANGMVGVQLYRRTQGKLVDAGVPMAKYLTCATVGS